jgi:hypothetical protein
LRTSAFTVVTSRVGEFGSVVPVPDVWSMNFVNSVDLRLFNCNRQVYDRFVTVL